MSYLSRLVSGLDKTVYSDHVFFFSPELQGEREQISSFLAGRRQFASLDVAEEERAVYLLDGDAVVLKFNRLRGWRKRIVKHFGFSSQRRYSLIDEFSNLRRLAGNSLVPKVYGFGRQRYGLLRDEFLLLEFIGGMQTVDDFAREKPERIDWLLEQVVSLFCRMCDQGFVHMDPHPKNILVNDEGEMSFIDFECCSFEASDRQFILAFSLGYFYYYWFQRFIDQESYDRLVLGALQSRERQMIDDRFVGVYLRYRGGRVGRKERYASLLSANGRKKFAEECHYLSEPFLTKYAGCYL